MSTLEKAGWSRCRARFVSGSCCSLPLLRYRWLQRCLTVAEKTKAILLQKGATAYELKSYAGLAHTVSMTELADVQAFLSVVLPPDDTCKIYTKAASDMSVKELREAIRQAGLGQKAVGLMEKQEFVKLLQEYQDGKL